MHKLLTYNYIYLIPLLLSAIFSLKSFGLKWPKPYRLFSVYLIITFITEAFAISWKWYLHETAYWNYSKSNLWVYNGFHVLRFSLFILFYYKMLHSSLTKKMIRYILIPLVCFGIINYIFIQSPHAMNNYTLILTNISCILLSLAFFRQLLKDKIIIKLSSHPMTWISFGSFIYYSGSLPFFIFFNYLFREHLTMAISLFYISHALNIFMYTSYLIAFLCKPHSQK